MEYKRDIFLSLPVGEENAITGTECAKRLGYASTRDFQKAVSDERRTGSLILSNGRGYYRPSSVEEVKRCYQTIRKRAVSTMAMLVEMRKWVQRHDDLDQMTVSEFLSKEVQDEKN